MKCITLVVPFYNEEDGIGYFFDRIDRVLSEIDGYSFEILCINDGSKDRTLKLLLEKKSQDSRVKIIDFSRNFGKESALSAGVDYASGDGVIPMDADLQDPPELLKEMIKRWEDGADVVLAKRANRDSDSFMKRFSAQAFYRIHNKLADYPIPENIGDFRLMDRRVVEALKLLPERRRFMKGLFSWVGFKESVIEYTRESRVAGSSKFNGWKLWNFALEGITSFSTAPLRIWAYIGLFISFVSFIYGSFIVIRTIIFGVDLPGYASIFSAVLFLGGIQLIGIGIIGEYIGRIYTETKQRPNYIVDKVY